MRLRKDGCEGCYYEKLSDIERCEELIKPEHTGWIGISNQKAIFNLLKKNQELEYKLKEKICFEGHSQYKALLSDLRYVLNQVLGAFEENWCIDWNFTDIREKYGFDDNYKEIDNE